MILTDIYIHRLVYLICVYKEEHISNYKHTVCFLSVRNEMKLLGYIDCFYYCYFFFISFISFVCFFNTWFSLVFFLEVYENNQFTLWSFISSLLFIHSTHFIDVFIFSGIFRLFTIDVIKINPFYWCRLRMQISTCTPHQTDRSYAHILCICAF